MHIQDWLRQENISQRKLAKALDISPVTAHKLVNGNEKPSKRLLAEIKKLTDGKVSNYADYAKRNKQLYVVLDNRKVCHTNSQPKIDSIWDCRDLASFRTRELNGHLGVCLVFTLNDKDGKTNVIA